MGRTATSSPSSSSPLKKKTQAANLHDAPGVIPADKQPLKLQINGSTIAGPYTMGKGDNVWVNVKEDFTGSVSVTLMEDDAGTDDNLGTVTISDGLAGDGILTAYFNAKTHADYHMTYDVHS